MSPIAVALLVVFLIGAGVGVYALIAPRRQAERERATTRRHISFLDSEWTSAAGEEFSGLSESARCEMIFAVAALDHQRAKQLLEHALDDPSEAVALAAAHALVRQGRRSVVQAYLAAHPDERTGHIAHTLDLLER